MLYIYLTIYILLELIWYLILLDVILSWLTLAGLQIRPKFISDIIDPFYKNIKSFIPTNIWPIDFTPIVAIIFIYFLHALIGLISPETIIYIQQLLS